ncbi:MAG: mechanosensitive ion channel [Bacteroidetes bacterium]|uniref:Mechanosensitive ion channel n=1 Tax=Candidatus Caccoplasma merdipullorum TaxID=2840718 RepID=A0A9D9E4R5_9BACT|nr:mechanosensitive ion channel [Candidatus Caccoplasma merdipullorum]
MEVTHPLAKKLVFYIGTLLDNMGVEAEKADKMEGWIYVIVIILLAFAVAFVLRLIVHRILVSYARNHGNETIKELIGRKVFARATYVLPPLIMITLIPLAYGEYPRFIDNVERACWLYFVISVLVYANFFISALWRILSVSEANRTRPLHGILQLVRGIVAGIGAIIIVAIILDKSPMKLITGLGAFAAVLMLVFKDSIIGFVSGVQLSQNDMIRKGDWINTADGTINGHVLDITLNTVKVRNFDNTILTLPPYWLISQPVQNWRGMEESGGRRIKFSVDVDTDSIVTMSPDLFASIGNLELLKGFIEKNGLSPAKPDFGMEGWGSEGVFGSTATNLGMFRAYLSLYLIGNPYISRELMVMTRLLQPTDNGVPLEIYCFSADKIWKEYEAIKSEIIERVFSSAALFKLRLYQNASGIDYLAAAYITAGKQVPDSLNCKL